MTLGVIPEDVGIRRQQALLPAGQCPLRGIRHDPHIELRLRPIGMILGNPVVATALQDRLQQHAAVMRIKDACFHARDNAELFPEQVRTLGQTSPPTPKRGQPE